MNDHNNYKLNIANELQEMSTEPIALVNGICIYNLIVSFTHSLLTISIYNICAKIVDFK